MKYIRFIVLGLAFFLFAGCENAWDLFQSAGENVSIERDITGYNEIYMIDRVNVNLVQDTCEKIILEGPKNLLTNVTTKVNNGRLKIIDNNNYGWINGFDHTITATVHIKNLNRIYYEGIGNLTALNQIVTDSLFVESIKSSGDIFLNVEADYFYCFFNHSMVDFNAEGNAYRAHLQINGTGFLRCENLVTSSCFVHNQGSGDIIAYSNGYIAGIIEGAGDVLYTGNPHERVFIYKGRGTGSFIEF